MLFHLFTVHGVPPPAHTKFPQCEECDYVALTASIMRKHLQKHQEGSENQCRVCSEPFASQQVYLLFLTFFFSFFLITFLFSEPATAPSWYWPSSWSRA